MLTFDQSREILDRISEELPEEIFVRLNGGIILLPDEKKQSDGLYILGEYHYDPVGFGRYITIYYGSFVKIGYSNTEMSEKLRDVLHHELTHHLEHLAGDKSLEYEDERQLEEYRRWE